MIPDNVRIAAQRELERRAVEREKYDWSKRARLEQRTPPGDWSYWLLLGGRGLGKTRTGSEQVRAWARTNQYVNLIAATAEDARTIMIEGESGILAICPKDERPVYLAHKNELRWPSGCKSLVFSAEEPERLRGKQHQRLWCDELAAWRYPEAWDQAKFGLRLGNHPQALITTTPRPTKILRDIISDPATVLTTGTTYDNRANLAPSFYTSIIRKYEGTRLGQQELEGKLLTDIAGALWSQSQIDDLRVSFAPELARVLVSIDPAVTSGEDADETGIVVVGKGSDGHGYVLADRTGRYSPGEWARIAIELFEQYRADAIIAEANNGGDLVEANIRTADANVPFRKVWASRGKVTRAEPVASLYEQGRFHHVGVFSALEDEMTSMTTDGKTGSASPNRADALVWGASELLIGGGTVTLFSEFRPQLRQGEPLNAVHVVQAQLQPWWYRWMSAAQGSFGKVVHWFCQEPDKRVLAYREKVWPDTLTPQQWGAEIARVSMVDVEEQASFELFVPQSFFEMATGRSIAQQISNGIIEVLGPDSTFLYELTEDERHMDAAAALESCQRRRDRLKGRVINLRASTANDLAMWQYMREMLRWKPLTDQPDLQLTRDQIMWMLDSPDGSDQYMAYARKLDAWRDEVLPKLRLVAECTHAIRFLSTAMRDPRHLECPLPTDQTLVVGHSLRCGIDGARNIQSQMPKEVFVASKLDQARAINPAMTPTSIQMVAREADRSWQKNNGAQSFSFARIPKRSR